MGRKISLFADYHGRENSVTNYCGLMFKLVYDESPKLFYQLIENCFDGVVKVPIIGPIFEQQKKGKNSIPDLQISQESFQILFETKNTDWYKDDQLERHSKGFNDTIQTKILVLLCNFEDKNENSERKAYEEKLRKKGIIAVELTFQNLLDCLYDVCKTQMLLEYVSEFEDYLDRNDHLPIWNYRLDVVNCAVTRDEIINGSVYMCPNSGGLYSHKRAQYFGSYWEKAVNLVFDIEAVIVIDIDYKNSVIKWKNKKEIEETELLRQAIDAVKKYRNEEIKRNGIQVFLLKNKHDVFFEKDTPGGLYGPKKYFYFKKCKDMDALVEIINNSKWSDYK